MALCNGLRVAFAAFPECFKNALLNALFHLSIKTSSLDAEIITELILSGRAGRLLEQKAALAAERNAVFDRIFPEVAGSAPAAAFFRWLPLPELPFDGVEIERRLLLQNISVYCSHRFAVTRHPDSFMRIAVSSPGSSAELERACIAIREFIAKFR